MSELLAIENLKVWFNTKSGVVRAVDGLSFSVAAGKTYALLGESGSGKTVSALMISQLLTDANFAQISGAIKFHGADLLERSEQQIQKLRGRKISFIFQEPMTALNPILTVAQQINEVLNKPSFEQVIELLEQVGLSHPKRCAKQYPHQLSGGMRQRVMIAIALASKPEILIADEPTTALDVTTQAQILSLIKSLQKKYQMAVLLITHDLSIVTDIVDIIGIIYAGQIVEQATPKEITNNPKHPYTFKLLQALPSYAKRDYELSVINNLGISHFGCRFSNCCEFKSDECMQNEIALTDKSQQHLVRCIFDLDKNIVASKKQIKTCHQPKSLLEVKNLSVNFPILKGLFKRQVDTVLAVNNISLSLKSGQTLAIVGESGCGKTTLARTIVGLQKTFTGQISTSNLNLNPNNHAQLQTWRKNIQIIFQDPYSAINPRMMIKDVVAEGAVALKIWHKDEVEQKAQDLLLKVGLRGNILHRYPHEFSGGQRQRIVIARALAVKPQILICDEPTSSLDVSVQAQVLNLLKNLQLKLNLAYLFITHNLHAVSWLADEILVMYLGNIVESAPAPEILNSPKHPYTCLLIESLASNKHQDIIQSSKNEIELSHNSGCKFLARCPKAKSVCQSQEPQLKEIGLNHQVACFL